MLVNVHLVDPWDFFFLMPMALKIEQRLIFFIFFFMKVQRNIMQDGRRGEICS